MKDRTKMSHSWFEHIKRRKSGGHVHAARTRLTSPFCLLPSPFISAGSRQTRLPVQFLKWRQPRHVSPSPETLPSHVTSKPWQNPHPISSVYPSTIATRIGISNPSSEASRDLINGVSRLIASISPTTHLHLQCRLQRQWIQLPRARRRSASSTAQRQRRLPTESQPSLTRSSFGTSIGGRKPI